MVPEGEARLSVRNSPTVLNKAYGFYEDSYGVSGGSGSHGTRGGGRHEYRHDKGGYYGSGNPRQQKDDNYFSHRGDYRGRRFQGRRTYGGGRGRF
jgi:hypothetical protein